MGLSGFHPFMQNSADHTTHQRAPVNVKSISLSSHKTFLLHQVRSPDTASSCTCQLLHSWEALTAAKYTNVQGTHMADELQIYKNTWRLHCRLNFYWDFSLTWKSIYVQKACDTSAEHFQAISVQTCRQNADRMTTDNHLFFTIYTPLLSLSSELLVGSRQKIEKIIINKVAIRKANLLA